jgi:hypothetical protein
VGAHIDRLVDALTSGGDERIAIDPTTGANRYGTPAVARPEDIWLCSSTANPLFPRGLAAAMGALSVLEGPDEVARAQADSDLCEAVRHAISLTLGLPTGHAVMAASGTDAELIALALAKSLMPGPLTNLVIAPEETGSSVTKAAGGYHFGLRANSGAHVSMGARLAGWETEDTAIATIAIRDAAGHARPASDVDKDVIAHAEAALAAGRSVLLHVLDRSKTGQRAPSRTAARYLAQRAPDRVMVLVDACQLRCTPQELTADLRDGFVAMVSGSKFAGGAPFSGALLLPPALFDALSHCLSLPPGLSAYSTLADWPAALAPRAARTLTRRNNVGLALRWTSALAELAALNALAAGLRAEIEAKFARIAHAVAAEDDLLVPVDAEVFTKASPCLSIQSFLTRKASGDVLNLAEARSLCTALQTLPDGERVYLGQPVDIAGSGALRICLSAPHINDIAERVAAGASREQAFAPLTRHITTAVSQWRRLAALL